MAQPSTRQELIDYCKRKLGAPVLEINVADEQIDDLIDDSGYTKMEYFDDYCHLTHSKLQELILNNLICPISKENLILYNQKVDKIGLVEAGEL
jgi:hypothetical protein